MQGLPGYTDDSQLALLVAQATDYAIFVMDTNGIVQSWNPGAERMNGYRREEIVGQHFSRFYTDDDNARDLAAALKSPQRHLKAYGGRLAIRGPSPGEQDEHEH